MFCKNDVVDNDYDFRWGMNKPKFEIVSDTLLLTNVPVPKIKHQETHYFENGGTNNLKEIVKFVLYKSHFLHDMRYRFGIILKKIKREESYIELYEYNDFSITDRIIRELHKEVIKHNGNLTIITFPSIERIINADQNKEALQSLCEELAIDFLDLTPFLKKSIFRTEYRGGHWNSLGHKIVAEAIYDYLKTKGIY